ncbi:MAG: RluA family pseudouridine synthase [Spirochaetaceae bacterium]
MNNDKYELFTIYSNDSLKRIDNVIRRFLPNMPLKLVFKSIRAGDIRVNSKKVKQNHRLVEGDVLWIYKPFLSHVENKPQKRSTSKIVTSRIYFENDHILLYNKPKGVLVHGDSDSLDIQIKEYLKDKIEKTLSFSPGPLHRLDRNTQGLIVFSKSLKGARGFTQMLQEGDIKKVYITIVDGEYSNKEEWNDKISRDDKTHKSFESIDGQQALSNFIPLYRKNGKTIALIEIKTGRTHQIRVQCKIHNRPLVGDNKYNNSTNYNTYFLSAISLSFSKNSDILSNKTFTLSLSSFKDKILNDLFNNVEIEKVEKLVQKGLKQL